MKWRSLVVRSGWAEGVGVVRQDTPGEGRPTAMAVRRVQPAYRMFCRQESVNWNKEVAYA